MKTKSYLVVVFATWLICCGLTKQCFAQTPMVGTDNNKATLVTVYEKTFADSIVDIVFDTATVSINKAKQRGWKEETFSTYENNRGSAEIFYTKFAIFKLGKKKTLKFYNKNDYLLKTIITKDNAEAIVSKNGKYIGITTPTKWIPKSGEHVSMFEMIDERGNLLWKIEGLGTGPYIPSPNGKLTIGVGSVEWEEAPVEIYNKKGLVKKIEKVYAGFTHVFSNDSGNMLFGVIQQKGQSKNNVLILTDNQGKTIWQKDNVKLNYYGDNGMEFSPSNELIVLRAISSDTVSSLMLFTKNGDNILNIEMADIDQGFIKYSFTENEKELFIATGFGHGWLVDIAAKKIMWHFKRTDERFEILTGTPKYERLIIGSYNTSSSNIYMLNREGKCLFSGDIKNAEFQSCPRIKINRKGSIVIIAIKKGLVVYTIKDER